MIQVKVRRRNWALTDAINLGIFNSDDIPGLIDLIDMYGIYGFSDENDPLFDRESYVDSQMVVNESDSYFEIITK